MDKSDVFEYENLDKIRDEIRLLVFSPDEKSEMLSLQLVHRPLSEVESHYDAFSYTWGNRSADNLIFVNGRRFYLRDNAHRFLLHQAGTGRGDALFWMDSICINQDDVEEKSWQVAMMDRIFARAGRVLIWLGKYSESEAIVESYGRYVRADYDIGAPRSLHKIYSRAKAAWSEKDLRIGSASKRVEKLTVVDAVKPMMGELLLADYWQRLWIVQEVVLAKTGLIIAGSALIDFQHMIDLVGFDDTQSPAGRFVMRVWAFRMSKRATTQRGERHGGGFTELINLCGPQACYDHRDRIYGMMGLSNDLRGLPVDYGESLELLFVKVLRRFIDNESGRTNVMIREFPTLGQALEVTSRSMSQALRRSDEEREALTRRDIPIEMACLCILRLLHCTKELYPRCSKDISGLWEPGDQHITLPSWSDYQPHCFEKTLPRGEMIDEFSSDPSEKDALICSITFIGGRQIVVASEPGHLRIQQCFSDEWLPDILSREYLSGFPIRVKTAGTFSINFSAADLTLLHESFETEQKMSESCEELQGLLLELGQDAPDGVGAIAGVISNNKRD